MILKPSTQFLILLCLVGVASSRITAYRSLTAEEPQPVENAEAKPEGSEAPKSEVAESTEPKKEEPKPEEPKPEGSVSSSVSSSMPSRSNLLKGDSGLTEEEKHEARKWFYTRYGVVAFVISLVFMSFMYGRDKTPLK